jgi:hypothetical protein
MAILPTRPICAMPAWPAGIVPSAVNGYAGRGPLLCGLTAHSGGSGPQPRGMHARRCSTRAQRRRAAVQHTCSTVATSLTRRWPATRSEWRRLWRRIGGAASSPADAHPVLSQNRMLIVCVPKNQVYTHTVQKMETE